MTSNLGAKELQKEVSLGFAAKSESDQKQVDQLHRENERKVRDELKKFMRPELLNRLDKTVVFRALSRKDISKIVHIQLEDLAKRLLNRKLGMKASAPLKKWLVNEGYDAKNGVRPLRRLIQEELEDRIAEALLLGTIQEGTVVSLGLKNKIPTVETITE